jgi:hypothetical protein
VPIVEVGRPVDAHAHPDTVLKEEVAPFGVNQGPIRLKTVPNIEMITQTTPYPRQRFLVKGRASRQGLAGVPPHFQHRTDRVPHSEKQAEETLHNLWSEYLIAVLVRQIAVRTGEVAERRRLNDDVLDERRGGGLRSHR